MARSVYIYSLLNGAMPKSYFKKKSQWQSAPPQIGTIIPLGSEGEPKGTLRQGVVTDVTEHSVLVGTARTTEDLRDCLTKGDYEEASPK